MSSSCVGNMWSDDGIRNQIIGFYKDNLVAIEGQNIVSTLQTSNLNIPYSNIMRYKIVLEPDSENIPLFSLDYGITFIGVIATYTDKEVANNIVEYRYNRGDVYLYLNKIIFTNSINENYLPNIFFNNPSETNQVILEVMVAYDEEYYQDNNVCLCDDDLPLIENNLRSIKKILSKKPVLNCDNLLNGIDYVTESERLNDVNIVDNKYYFQTDLGRGMYIRNNGIWHFEGKYYRGKVLNVNYDLNIEDIGYSLMIEGDLTLNINDNIFSDYHKIRIVVTTTINLNIVSNMDFISFFDMGNLKSGIYNIEMVGNKIYLY